MKCISYAEAIQFVNWLREVEFRVDRELEVFRCPAKQIGYAKKKV